MTIFVGFDEAVVVDVETTGLDPEKDRIISVAMVRAFHGIEEQSKRSARRDYGCRG